MIELKRLIQDNAIKHALQKDNLVKELMNTDDLDSVDTNTDRVYWYQIIEDSKNIGVFCLSPLYGKIVCFHGGLYKEYRHKNTTDILRQCFNKILGSLDVVLITTINSNNKPAMKLVEKAGFVYKTTIHNGFRNGDLLIYAEV